jgi:hypothetical protein
MTSSPAALQRRERSDCELGHARAPLRKRQVVYGVLDSLDRLPTGRSMRQALARNVGNQV